MCPVHMEWHQNSVSAPYGMAMELDGLQFILVNIKYNPQKCAPPPCFTWEWGPSHFFGLYLLK